jgi:hypothetical protein
VVVELLLLLLLLLLQSRGARRTAQPLRSGADVACDVAQLARHNLFFCDEAFQQSFLY